MKWILEPLQCFISGWHYGVRGRGGKKGVRSDEDDYDDFELRCGQQLRKHMERQQVKVELTKCSEEKHAVEAQRRGILPLVNKKQ